MRSSLLKKHYQAQDENLGTYFEHLNGFLQKEAYTSEIYMHEELPSNRNTIRGLHDFLKNDKK